MSPAISIIIPVYNVAPYLRECLDSVLAQTFADWEAICVDDGSTDGSSAMLDEYAAKDKRFRVIHQPNAGVSAARNRALNEATGELLCFLDADYTVGAEWLHDIAQGAINHPGVDWIRVRHRCCKDGVFTSSWVDVNAYGGSYWEGEEIPRVAWMMLADTGVMVDNIYRRSLVATAKFDEQLVWHEDTCFVANIIPIAKSLCWLPCDAYVYRFRPDSASHKVLRFKDVCLSMAELERSWAQSPGDANSLCRVYWYCISACVSSGYSFTKDDKSLLKRVLKESSKQGYLKLSHLPVKMKLRWLAMLATGEAKMLTAMLNPIHLLKHILLP